MTLFTESTKIKNPFDSFRSILIAMYMTLVGYGVLVGVPVICTAWVNLLGFSEEQVGRIVGMDLAGLTIGAVTTALFVRKINRRFIVLFGILIAVAANGMCLIGRDYQSVLFLRLLSGIGSGIYTAVAVATLGGSSKPAKTYTLMMLAFAFSQAIEMHLLPRLSMNGIYLAFIFAFVLTLPFLGWLPTHPVLAPSSHGESSAAQNGPLASNVRGRLSFALPMLCLAAIFFTYVNIGAYWTYIELAALSSGIEKAWIVPLLTWVSLGSIAGCLGAMFLSDRFGFSKPLLSALFGMFLIAGILSFGINHLTLFVSLALFNMLWVFIDVYQMSTIAVIDRTGSFVSLLPAVQGLGQIAGPNIAASILGAGLGYSKVFVMCAGAVSIGMMFYLGLYIFTRKLVPELSGRKI